MMTKGGFAETVGNIGEKIVMNEWSKLGSLCAQSLDKYDRMKDLTIDGKTVEVKTQAIFVTQQCLSFAETQLAKCKSVDQLIMVAVPIKNKQPTDSCGNFGVFQGIYLVDINAAKYRRYTTKSGTNMILIDFRDPAVKKHRALTSDEVDQLQKYTKPGI